MLSIECCAYREIICGGEMPLAFFLIIQEREIFPMVVLIADHDVEARHQPV